MVLDLGTTSGSPKMGGAEVTWSIKVYSAGTRVCFWEMSNLAKPVHGEDAENPLTWQIA